MTPRQGAHSSGSFHRPRTPLSPHTPAVTRVAPDGAAPLGAEPSLVTPALGRAPSGAVRRQDPPPAVRAYCTTMSRVVVGEPAFSNQSMPSLTRSNFKA